MRTKVCVIGIGLVLSACGARTQENHTGGKTSWLSTCREDVDCDALGDAVCAARLCTTACRNGCSIDGTSCVSFTNNVDSDDTVTAACLPECEGDADCSRFGDNYTCDANACVLSNVRVMVSEERTDAPVEDASVELFPESPSTTVDSQTTGASSSSAPPPEYVADAGENTQDAASTASPVHDIAGVVLLDNGDDGNNTPLEDPERPAEFDSFGFWYTYHDIGTCMDNELPNEDTMAQLSPAEGENLTTTSYAAIGISPPPETLPNAPDNTHGIRFSGGGQEYYGAGLGYKFAEAYDQAVGLDLRAAGYNGVRFWAYSPVETTFIVKFKDAYSIPEAGLCIPRGPFPECAGDENCINGPVQYVSVGPEWTLYEVYFAEVVDDPSTTAVEVGPFRRENWAGRDVEGNEIKDIPPMPERIYQLQFQTASASGSDGTFELVIDNVGFIVAGGPEDNASGEFTPAPLP